MLEKPLIDEHTAEFQAWRQQWITKLLSLLLILCVPSLLLSLYVFYRFAALWGVFVVVGASVATAILRFYRRVSYHVQVIGVLFIIFTVALVLLVRTGFGGLGYILLLLVPFITYPFLGRSAAVTVLILTLIALVVTGIVYFTNTLAIQVALPHNTPAAWFANMLAFLLVSLVFMQSQHYLLPRFNATLLQARELGKSLETQRAEVEKRLARERLQADRVERIVALGSELMVLRDREEIGHYLVNQLAQILDLYQVNLFIVDDRGEQLKLVAALPGKAEQLVRMGWQMPISGTLLPSAVARSRRERAVVIGTDDVYRGETFHFPQTRAEVCFPLIFQEELLGVLDIHSSHPAASGPFMDADLQVFRIIAWYTATVLGVSRLLEAAELQLREIQAMYLEHTAASWSEWLESGAAADHTVGEIAKEDIAVLATSAVETREPQSALLHGAYVLVLPLVAREITLGYVAFSRTVEKGPWDPLTLSLLKQASERLALAFDNTRLLTESRQRAFYEEQLSRFSELIWESLKVDTIMERSVQELGRFLGASEVTLALPSRTEVTS